MQPGLEVCTALTHGMDAARGFASTKPAAARLLWNTPISSENVNCIDFYAIL